jgi:hypothetical protein
MLLKAPLKWAHFGHVAAKPRNGQETADKSFCGEFNQFWAIGRLRWPIHLNRSGFAMKEPTSPEHKPGTLAMLGEMLHRLLLAIRIVHH